MSWIDTAGVVVFGLVAAYCAARLAVSFRPGRTASFVRPGSGERLCDATHAAMGGGMALMSTPHTHLLPASAGVTVFAALGAGTAATMLANGAGARAGMDESGDGGHGAFLFDVLAGCVAMVYMYAARHGAAPAASAASAVVPGQHAHAAGTVPILGWLLVTYVVVAVASGGFRAGTRRHPAPARPVGGGPAARLLTSPSVLHWCEVAMAAGMAVMLARAV